MELHGKIALIKYVRKITDIGLVEAKEIVDAFVDAFDSVRICDGAPIQTYYDWDIVILSLFVGKVRSGAWVIRDGKVKRETDVLYRDIVDLSHF